MSEDDGQHIIKHMFSKEKIILIGNRSCMYTCYRLTKMCGLPSPRTIISKGDNDVVNYPKDWDDTETKKASYDLKVGKILIFTLSVTSYFPTRQLINKNMYKT